MANGIWQIGQAHRKTHHRGSTELVEVASLFTITRGPSVIESC